MTKIPTVESLFKIIEQQNQRIAALEQQAHRTKARLLPGGLNAWIYTNEGNGSTQERPRQQVPFPNSVQAPSGTLDLTNPVVHGVNPSGNASWVMSMEGYLYVPVAGTWVFSGYFDDTTTVRVNGRQVINQGGGEMSVGTGIYVPAGFAPISIKWRNEGGGSAIMRLRWQNTAGGFATTTVIPLSYFFYETPVWVPAGAIDVEGYGYSDSPTVQRATPWVGNFRNYSTDWNAMYRRWDYGLCEFKGLIGYSAAASGDMMILPDRMRPAVQGGLIFNPRTSNGAQDVRLTNGDRLNTSADPGGWVSLAEISYHVGNDV